jgi:phosphatidate phosphatase
MVFLVLYLQACVKITSSLLLKPMLQIIPITLALLCGISRVSDYKHHWSDVMTGFILGTLVAYVVVWQLIQWFKDTSDEKRKLRLKDIV